MATTYVYRMSGNKYPQVEHDITMLVSVTPSAAGATSLQSRNPDERAIPLGDETRACATSTKHHFQHDLLDEDLTQEYDETQRDSRSN